MLIYVDRDSLILVVPKTDSASSDFIFIISKENREYVCKKTVNGTQLHPGYVFEWGVIRNKCFYSIFSINRLEKMIHHALTPVVVVLLEIITRIFIINMDKLVCRNDQIDFCSPN